MKEMSFTTEAWQDYLYWQTQDKKTLKRINLLLKDISRDYYSGLGRPEALKYGRQGEMSREIDEKNRLVYEIISETQFRVKSCKDHYDD
ncbi:MAG: Txe/YoeB family addiction module toxin [Oscillospiraceae bacterium]|jgi:toxin YoeB|nr:Txe/YoeB family addiction module toxin [Oscillospiraceae bacterium]